MALSSIIEAVCAAVDFNNLGRSHRIQKGGLKDPGNAELLLGIASYNGERPNQARTYFSRASKFDATKAEAERWLTHISTETANAEGAEGEPEAESESG